MTNLNRPVRAPLQQFLDWHDHRVTDHDEFQKIVAQVRSLLQRSDLASASAGKYVLYDFDQDRLVKTEVYTSYSDAADEAVGLDDVLILMLPFPICASNEPTGGSAITPDDQQIDDSKCDCEVPGYFWCGVPGILAHLEQGRLAPGALVERCDQCQRYESDEAARRKLAKIGICD